MHAPTSEDDVPTRLVFLLLSLGSCGRRGFFSNVLPFWTFVDDIGSSLILGLAASPAAGSPMRRNRQPRPLDTTLSCSSCCFSRGGCFCSVPRRAQQEELSQFLLPTMVGALPRCCSVASREREREPSSPNMIAAPPLPFTSPTLGYGLQTGP